jgi:hypothetical protein
MLAEVIPARRFVSAVVIQKLVVRAIDYSALSSGMRSQGSFAAIVVQISGGSKCLSVS